MTGGKAASLMAARAGGGPGNEHPHAIPGAADTGRLPALRFVAALVFLIPGGALLLIGVALCWPWLSRLAAALQLLPRLVPGELLEPNEPAERDPSEQVPPQTVRARGEPGEMIEPRIFPSREPLVIHVRGGNA